MHLPALLFTALLSASAVLGGELHIKKVLSHKCSRVTQNGDRVKMHYRGTLEDGTKFDASYDRNQPLPFTIGKGMVIQGWEKGLLEMCPGDKRILTIPPEMGYGQRSMGPIPAGSTLIFETELLEIEGVAAEDKVVIESEETSTEEKEPKAEEAPKEANTAESNTAREEL